MEGRRPEQVSTSPRILHQLSRVFRGAGVLTVATLVANVSNYAFQVLLGRWMGPEEYGLLSSAFTFVAVFGTSTSSLQAALAKSEARRGFGSVLGPRRSLARSFGEPVVRWILLGTLGISALVILASPWIDSSLGAEDPTAVVLALMLPGTALASVAFGRMQGTRRFTAFAVLAVVLAVSKLIGGAIAGLLGLGVPAVLGILVVCTTVVAVGGIWYTSDCPAVSPRDVLRDSARALVALTLFWLVISIDVPLARHYLDDGIAGQYAAASLIGRSVLWLPAVIAVVVFPQMARLNDTVTGARDLLIKSCIATAAICAAACVALFVLSPIMFRTLFGDGYEEASRLAWQLGVVSLPLAVANVLVYFLLSRSGWYWMPALLVPLLVEVVWIAIAHTSTTDFVLASLASAVVLVVLLGAAAAHMLSTGRHQSVVSSAAP